jgi:DNA-binding MarR family transcriptional regulator
VPITQPIYLSDSRLALMGELSQTERIPTDIALRLGKSKSTVVEQLDELCNLGLVERLAQPGKKFVFYRLSRSGRQALLQRADQQRQPSAPMWPI